MTSGIFSGSECCLACEKPLKDSNASYCDEKCKAEDGFVKQASGLNMSPSIMASLPPLLASTIKSSSLRPQGMSPSASASSQSETSSPLQSPSPLSNPVYGLSPKEDSFSLPPPLYTHHPYMNGYSTTSHFVKPSAYKSPNAYEPRELHSGAPVKHSESTLQYNRRPGQTNSVTSPMAMLPVGSHKRTDPARPGSQVLSPAFLPWRSPAVQPTRHVSDSVPIGSEKRKSFPYGNHSPYLLPTSSSRPPSPSVNLDNVNAHIRDRSPASSASALKSTQNAQYAKQTRSGSITRGSVRQNGPDERRKSFPAHLFQSFRPKFNQSATQSHVNEQTVASESSEDEDVLGLKVGQAEDESRRGRSRDRKSSIGDREGSRAATRSRSKSRPSRDASSHLGLAQVTHRDQRSRSRKPRDSTQRLHSTRRGESRSTSRERKAERNHTLRPLGSGVSPTKWPQQQLKGGQRQAGGVTSSSPPVTIRAGRHSSHGKDLLVSPMSNTHKALPSETQANQDWPSAYNNRRDSRATQELKRLYVEGLPVT